MTRNLPDLVPDVTETYMGYDFTVDPETNEIIRGTPKLFFDTFSQNLGPVALDLVSDEPTNLEDPAVSQCTAWRANKLCRERQPVGGFLVHPTHGHFHFDDFASYELRRFLADGTPDYSSAGLVGASDKVSFCLVDSREVAPHADTVPTYITCNGFREGISAGWADIYTSDLDGQQISLGSNGDGTYALIVTMNPSGNVYESTMANNRVVATVVIDGVEGDEPTAVITNRTWS